MVLINQLHIVLHLNFAIINLAYFIAQCGTVN